MSNAINDLILKMKNYGSSEEQNDLYNIVLGYYKSRSIRESYANELIFAIYRLEIRTADELNARIKEKMIEDPVTEKDILFEEELEPEEINQSEESKPKVKPRKENIVETMDLDDENINTVSKGINVNLNPKKNYKYKLVEAPGVIEGSTSHVLSQYEDLLNSNARDGWMYYGTQSVNQIIYPEPAGCLAALFGKQNPPINKTVIFLIFVKETII